MARKIILKNNGLSGTSTPNGFTSIGMDGTTVSKQVGATNSAIGGLTEPKLYKALLTQSGTASPVATVLVNTLSGTPVWSYNDVGSYYLTLVDEFVIGKTIYSVPNTEGSIILVDGNIDDDWIQLSTFSFQDLNNSENDRLWMTPITIEVYP